MSGAPWLRGIFPIVYTPFDEDDRIVVEDLHRLIDHLIAAGAHGLAAVGSASECHRLTHDERRSLAEETMRAARGRVPVIVGVSATNRADALALARHAAERGAKAIFSAPPLHGPMDAPALRSYFIALADAVALPVIVQDALVPLPLGLIAELAAARPNLAFVKEEVPEMTGHRISALRALSPELSILSGGVHLIDELERGAVGAIPGSVGTADLVAAYERLLAGDIAGARARFDHFTPLSFWRRQFPLLGAKEVLRRLGVFTRARLRAPAGEHLDEQDHRELTALMERMGPPF